MFDEYRSLLRSASPGRSLDTVSPLKQPARDRMLDDSGRGIWLAEPVDQCEGPVRLYPTNAGVACAEQFGSDTARYVAAQRQAASAPGSNMVTIHGPASGVVVGSHGVTQHAGHAVRSSGVDAAGLARFAEAVAKALPALALSPGDQQAAQTLTGQIVKAASEPKPGHPRLKALGGSLRAILEGTVGRAGRCAPGTLAPLTARQRGTA